MQGCEVRPVLFTTHSEFGMQKEVFNVHGNAAIHQGKASFMGVRSMEGLEGLAKGLNLESARNQVHMAVICSKIGKRVQVSSSGLLERQLLTKFPRNMRVDGRMFEHTNTVRLCVHKFTRDGGIFDLEERFRPQKNDWAVTGRGTVMARFTWHKRIEWTRECEEAFIQLCDRVTKECLLVPDIIA